MSKITGEVHDYSAGTMKSRYGLYEHRTVEYRQAVMASFNRGLMRKDSPILDVGCRNPYQGLLRFLREFGWEGTYTGIDIDFDPEVIAQVEEDDITVMMWDLEWGNLPLPGPLDPPKQIAVAFCIEVLEHLHNQDALIAEMQRVAAQVYVVGPNADFRGYYAPAPWHLESLSAERLRAWGFQRTGYVNYNGWPHKGAKRQYPRDNGICETSSEVWGVWLDPKAEELVRPREEHRARIDAGRVSEADMMRFRALVQKAGHSFISPRTEAGR